MLFKVKAGIPAQPLTSGFRIHWAQSGTTLSLNLYWTKLFTSGERSKKYVLSCEFLETNFSKWIYSFGKFCPTFLYWRDQSGGLMVPPKSGREWSNYPFSHVEQSVQIPPYISSFHSQFPQIFWVFIWMLKMCWGSPVNRCARVVANCWANRRARACKYHHHHLLQQIKKYTKKERHKQTSQQEGKGLQAIIIIFSKQQTNNKQAKKTMKQAKIKQTMKQAKNI